MRIADDQPIRSARPGTRLAIRLGMSAAMVGVLVWQLDDVSWRDLGPRWSPSSPWWIAAAAITTFAAFALSTLRWRSVLAPLATAPAFGRMFSHFLAGQFVSNVLPTAFGGDVVRIARLGNDVGQPAAAFASVAIERLTGWLVLPVITLATLATHADYRDLGTATATAVVTALVTLAALTAVLAAAANRRWTAGATMASGWRRWLAAVHLGVDGLRRSPRQLAAVLGAGLSFQIMQCVAVWFAARAVGVDEITLGASLAFFPAAAIMQNLPIGVGGLGVREGAFVLFFGALGTEKAQAITLGLAVYLLTVLTSSLGAPAFLLGGRRSHRSTGRPAPNPHDADLSPPPRGS